MKPNPLRLLLTGYALSIAHAALALAAGAGWTTAIMIFWLGGAGCVVGLALLPISWFRNPESVGDADRAQEHAASAARWSEDLADDAASGQDSAAASG